MEIQHFIAHKQSNFVSTVVEDAWDGVQKRCAGVFKSVYCEAMLVLLVCYSFVLVVMEADYGEDVPTWLTNQNVAIMWIYVLEMLVRIFLYRLWFFTSPVNLFEFFIVMLELVTQALASKLFLQADLPSVAPLRLVRLLRLARGYKVLVKFPMLGLMVKGLISGTSAALYGIGLLLVILAIWAVVAVHFIHPINERVSLTGAYDGCYRCPNAFVDVRSSMLTFFQQIIAGDSWGVVTMPIIEEEPTSTIFFGLVFISVQFTMMNVILAVIVDSSLKASQEDVDDLLKQKHESMLSARTFLLEICKEMDKDETGDLSEAELLTGYRENKQFREILTSMDITKDDMRVVFDILDVDDDGRVDHQEFIGELFRMKQHDSHTLLIFIKHYTKVIKKDLEYLKGKTHGAAEKSTDLGSREEKQRAVLEPADPSCAIIEATTRAGQAAVAQVGGEMKSLREQLGEELDILNAVVSDQLMVRMQELNRKFGLHENGESKAKTLPQLDTADLLKGGGTGRTARARISTWHGPGATAESLSDTVITSPRQPQAADRRVCAVASTRSSAPSLRPRQPEAAAERRECATVTMPSSVWGIRARNHDSESPEVEVRASTAPPPGRAAWQDLVSCGRAALRPPSQETVRT